MKTRFLIIIGIIFVILTGFATYPVFGQEQTCDINNEIEARKILDQDPVVQEFLKRHPSAIFEHPPNYDEGNPWTTSTFYHNGLSLGVIASEQDPNDDCYWIRAYNVEYEMPSTGTGIGWSRTNTFESDKIDDAILAVRELTNPHEQMKKGIPLPEIKCREGLHPIPRIDRVRPACVTDSTWNELLTRGWTPLRLGMPAETNILITYNATMLYPQKTTKEFDSQSPVFNMVFWVNNDIIPHVIIANDKSWSTGQIESGKVGSMFFNNTGIYTYFVKDKPQTTGTITFEITKNEN